MNEDYELDLSRGEVMDAMRREFACVPPPRARPPRAAPAHLGFVGSTHAHIKDAKTMDVMIFKGAQVRSAREHSPRSSQLGSCSWACACSTWRR